MSNLLFARNKRYHTINIQIKEKQNVIYTQLYIYIYIYIYIFTYLFNLYFHEK